MSSVSKEVTILSHTHVLAGAAALALLTGACASGEDDASAAQRAPTAVAPGTLGDGLPQGSKPVTLDPAEFTTQIDNPYWSMTPGNRWVYRETDDEGNVERVEVTVTDRTKTVAAGVVARVVRDVKTEGRRVVEDTDDWYAQDAEGNIWYLGEDTEAYEDGKTSTAGAWEAGVDGAQAGVIMPANPQVGMTYRQEYYAGEAEGNAAVLSLDEQAQVPFGQFKGALLTKEYSPLEPEVLEYKLHAKGVGPVLIIAVSGDWSRSELVTFTKAR